ncbi:tryptophan synthase subunit beta [Patulibacter brassicae]|uniref:Tryptophan synthase beta chain n=1 Tax=Patulibacter brassicae TaxID=1705717 RepID=A0ABU4VFJ4_9ACTN|nr:tryptophan synthase subunit beta [Patulibacter brassicae]MDX8150606.1 tryptophan synthase subunit beta [Patulibacter brassicae]
MSTPIQEQGVERRYGPYGGRYVPETLIPALDELERAWATLRTDAAFQAELRQLSADYAGRPTPLYLARRISEQVGRQVYLKREDLLHSGAHKINNALGQCLIARWMGKKRVIAETGAGQHGVATATAAALLNLDCTVYMGSEDMRRQHPNVQRMRLLGATVAPVESGRRTLKEATSEAIRAWVAEVADTHYVLGTAGGPAPYPALVRDLQRVIGDEARAQVLQAAGRLPDRVVACVGGGSNAIGIFAGFLDDPVALVGVEAGGHGLESGAHGAVLTSGLPGGILHGALSPVLQDEQGQILEAHSISAGLDYPGVGPQHAWLRDSGRATYVAAQDDDALRAFREVARLEGIIPALESSHALHHVLREPAPDVEIEVVCLSGRGDKDLVHALASLEELEGEDALAVTPRHPRGPHAGDPRTGSSTSNGAEVR